MCIRGLETGSVSNGFGAAEVSSQFSWERSNHRRSALKQPCSVSSRIDASVYVASMTVDAASGPNVNHGVSINTRRVFLVAAYCGLALLLWVLAGPLQQIYWATSARYLEGKGGKHVAQDQRGDHSCASAAQSYC